MRIESPTTKDGLTGRLSNILSGWKNMVFANNDIEILATQRLAVCDLCHHKKALTCELCDVPLELKLRSPENSCPDRRWAQ